jgi:transposase InsO family protein
MKTAMSVDSQPLRSHEQWARFRFSVVGPLLAAPPARGQLQEELKSLAAKKWRHPLTGQWVQFGLSTIEGWYYTARNEKRDPVQALRRKIRSDQGQHPALNPPVRELLLTQYRQHPSWSYQLHADNVAVLIEKQPALGTAPSYASVLRYMKDHGLVKRPRRGPLHSPGAQAAEHRFQSREVRSYESEYVHALWHLDFHHGSVRVLLDKGQWVYPLLLGIIDDHSRLCCHAQWYLAEGAEELCHGLSQAFQKRALPLALMTDNGSAMLATETTEGLARLSIVHETTFYFSPNVKNPRLRRQRVTEKTSVVRENTKYLRRNARVSVLVTAGQKVYQRSAVKLRRIDEIAPDEICDNAVVLQGHSKTESVWAIATCS